MCLIKINFGIGIRWSKTLLFTDYSRDVKWPSSLSDMKFGQVAGVSVGGGGEVVIFHRGNHVWDSQSFDMQNQFLEKDLGPISSPTVLVFHPDTGALLHEWGESMWVEHNLPMYRARQWNCQFSDPAGGLGWGCWDWETLHWLSRQVEISTDNVS